MREFSGIPLLLIIIGVGYLLANLGLISLTPGQALIRYWPILIILIGAKILVRDYIKARFRSSFALVFSVVLIALGTFILLPRLGFTGFRFSWNLIWPIGLIIIGLSIIFSPQDVFQWKSRGKHSLIVGELHRGGEAWYVEDTNIAHGIGEIQLDLTNAVIPNKEIFFCINGMIGEVTIYIPRDLPLKAFCRVKVGEITVLDQNVNGISRTIDLETPEYSSSERKLSITASMKIGEITIRRIG